MARDYVSDEFEAPRRQRRWVWPVIGTALIVLTFGVREWSEIEPGQIRVEASAIPEEDNIFTRSEDISELDDQVLGLFDSAEKLIERGENANFFDWATGRSETLNRRLMITQSENGDKELLLANYTGAIGVPLDPEGTTSTARITHSDGQWLKTWTIYHKGLQDDINWQTTQLIDDASDLDDIETILSEVTDTYDIDRLKSHVE